MTQNLAIAVKSIPDAVEVSNKIAGACADAKAKDITVLNVTRLSDLFNYFVIASAHSDRQVQGITNRILDTLAKVGLTPISLEGLDQGHWVVIDCGEVIVHVFYEPMRSHYNLEGLWAKAARVELLK